MKNDPNLIAATKKNIGYVEEVKSCELCRHSAEKMTVEPGNDQEGPALICKLSNLVEFEVDPGAHCSKFKKSSAKSNKEN